MKVVNLRKEKYTHYIGRGSVFGNPFKITTVVSREKSIELYERYLRKSIAKVEKGDIFTEKLPQMIYALPENAILGCYCKPKACHGDVIIKIWKEFHNEK